MPIGYVPQSSGVRTCGQSSTGPHHDSREFRRTGPQNSAANAINPDVACLPIIPELCFHAQGRIKRGSLPEVYFGYFVENSYRSLSSNAFLRMEAYAIGGIMPSYGKSHRKYIGKAVYGRGTVYLRWIDSH